MIVKKKLVWNTDGMITDGGKLEISEKSVPG
jgi:hypothetical protein